MHKTKREQHRCTFPKCQFGSTRLDNVKKHVRKKHKGEKVENIDEDDYNTPPIKEVLDQEAEGAQEDVKRHYDLINSILNDDFERSERLIRNAPDLKQAFDEYGRHALYLAGARSRLELIDLMLQQCSKVMGKLDCVYFVIKGAAQAGRDDIIDYIVHCDFVKGLFPTNILDEALEEAVMSGHQEAVVKLLNHGANPDYLYDWPKADSLLTLAVARGHANVVAILLSRGASVGYNSVRAACKARHFDIAKTLLVASNGRDWCEALEFACKFGLCDVARELLRVWGPFSFQRCSEPHRAIGKALAECTIRSAREELYEMLTKAGVCVDCGALQQASLRGDAEFVETLIKSGATVKHSSWTVQSALSAACAGGSLKVCQLLIDAGADVNKVPSNTTPLIECCKYGRKEYFECIQLLLHHGAALDATVNGTTALGAAAHQGDIQIVKTFLAAGANPDRGSAMKRPLSRAIISKNLEVVRLLLGLGVSMESLYHALLSATNALDPESLRLLFAELGRVRMRTFMDFNIINPRDGLNWWDLLTVKQLLRKRRDSNDPTPIGTIMIYIACSKQREGHTGNVSTARALFNAGAKLLDPFQAIELAELAIQKRETEMIQLLEEHYQQEFGQRSGVTERGFERQDRTVRIDATGWNHAASQISTLRQVPRAPNGAHGLDASQPVAGQPAGLLAVEIS